MGGNSEPSSPLSLHGRGHPGGWNSARVHWKFKLGVIPRNSEPGISQLLEAHFKPAIHTCQALLICLSPLLIEDRLVSLHSLSVLGRSRQLGKLRKKRIEVRIDILPVTGAGFRIRLIVVNHHVIPRACTPCCCTSGPDISRERTHGQSCAGVERRLSIRHRDIAIPRISTSERIIQKGLSPIAWPDPHFLLAIGNSHFTPDMKVYVECALGLPAPREASTIRPASAIVSLKRSWETDFKAWKKNRVLDRYVYLFADGVHVSVRLGEDKRLCLLVVIGVAENGEKHLLAVEPGYRESKESWTEVLRDLRDRGLNAPVLAVGDGALGFWSALRATAGFESTREQRCWLHKMGNVLNEFHKCTQPRAKTLLREIMNAETISPAAQAKKKFIGEFEPKFPKATAKIVKDWSELTAFFSLPAVHWMHLRTTNPIESTSSTVRLRSNVTRGAGSPLAAATMAFKLLQDAEKNWNRIRGHGEIGNVLGGVEYRDGIMVPAPTTRSEAPVRLSPIPNFQ